MKVITTKESSERRINLRGLGILDEGIELDLPEERAKELMGNNIYGLHFVVPANVVDVKPKTIASEVVKEEVKEEPIKEKKPVKKAKNTAKKEG